jgi:hypothetical protein
MAELLAQNNRRNNMPEASLEFPTRLRKDNSSHKRKERYDAWP